jgi:hypothetical protein
MTPSLIHAYFQAQNKHASIDIETLGTREGSVIIEIGACLFNPLTGESSDHLHIAINEGLSRSQGFSVDNDTINWWSKRGGIPPEPTVKQEPESAVKILHEWFEKTNPSYIWARGMDFERPLIEAYCQKFNRRLPWKHYQGRDTRTLFDLIAPNSRVSNDVHRALPDAIMQGEQTALALRTLLPLPETTSPDRKSLPTFTESSCL